MEPKLIILAAGQGTRLSPYTDNIPKSIIPLHGVPLLEWQIKVARKCGIKEIIVVKGYKQEKINIPNITYFLNKNYATTNMVETLMCAKEFLSGEVIVSYGDIIYEPSVLDTLIHSENEISIIVDEGWEQYWRIRFTDPLDDAESLNFDSNNNIKTIGERVNNIKYVKGQYIGLMKFSDIGIKKILSTYNRLKDSQDQFQLEKDIKNLFMTDLLMSAIKMGHKLSPVLINRKWLEIDNRKDYDFAKKTLVPTSNLFKIIE